MRYFEAKILIFFIHNYNILYQAPQDKVKTHCNRLDKSRKMNQKKKITMIEFFFFFVFCFEECIKKNHEILHLKDFKEVVSDRC